VSDLADARDELAEFLNTISGVRAVTVIPQTFTPPICWVAAGSPYRQRAQAVGMKRINLTVLCLGGMSTNDATEEATEDLAESVANALDKDLRWRLDPLAEMDQPRLYPSSQGQQMLGIAVNLSREATRD
jgi:hypothetical protein